MNSLRRLDLKEIRLTMTHVSDAVIVVEGVHKRYGDFRAVDDLSFTVKRGEIFALLGPNGAGKSTSIRMILDLLKPDAGRITLFGAPIDQAAKDRIGYLPEERGLYKNVPVIEVMTYLGKLKGLSSSEARRRAMAYLERLELADFAKKKVSDLSKGMQQKVQFAVTILHDPDVIIVDEPFSGLDPVNTLTIKELIGELRTAGKAIIMSTHQMNQVEAMADRLLMIDRGTRRLYGEVEAVRQSYAQQAVRVVGTGAWATLSGIESVEFTGDRDEVLLHLADGATADQVLSQIAGRTDISIRRFELALPSLDEIFVQIVRDRADQPDTRHAALRAAPTQAAR